MELPPIDALSSASQCAPPYAQIKPLRRFLEITFTVYPALGLYFIIDRCQSVTPTEVMMPSWVPFWPSFTLPYMGMLLMTWLLPVTIRDARRFRACLLAFICGFLLVMPWWMLTPTTLPRPPLPEDWWAAPYCWITAMDPPNNVMPCAHGIGPVVAAWFAIRDRPTWRWPLVAMLVVGLPSIALVWQHRPVDILLGTVASVIGIAIGEKWSRFPAQSSPKTMKQPSQLHR
ncbi:MAG: hypothetical protein JWR69_1239 [Pedosphaera sp.]|nr:hypothetical protein [Pedosphaera sp.]